MTLNSWPSCLHLPSGGIAGILVIPHHAQVKKSYFIVTVLLGSPAWAWTHGPPASVSWTILRTTILGTRWFLRKIVKSSLIRYHWLFHCCRFTTFFVVSPLFSNGRRECSLIPSVSVWYPRLTLLFKSGVRGTLLYLVFICKFWGFFVRWTHISNDYIFLVTWNLTITECCYCL